MSSNNLSKLLLSSCCPVQVTFMAPLLILLCGSSSSFLLSPLFKFFLTWIEGVSRFSLCFLSLSPASSCHRSPPTLSLSLSHVSEPPDPHRASHLPIIKAFLIHTCVGPCLSASSSRLVQVGFIWITAPSIVPPKERPLSHFFYHRG